MSAARSAAPPASLLVSKEWFSVYLCVVISSIGQTDRLRDLLRSLGHQQSGNFVVVVCDQSADGSVTETCSEFRGAMNIIITTSMRGLSLGRNTAIAAAPEECTHFMFPNDTSSLPRTLMAELAKLHEEADIVVMSYVDDNGVRYRFPAGREDLTFSNVWKAIEAGTVISKRVINHTGGFDSSLGTGSSGPWQSGEGTDLLIRAMSAKPKVHWAPDLRVNGVAQDFGLDPKLRRQKLRAYGRGYGRVLSKWKYPLRARCKACLGAFVRAADPRNQMTFVDAFYSSVGRLEGVLGRIF